MGTLSLRKPATAPPAPGRPLITSTSSTTPESLPLDSGPFWFCWRTTGPRPKRRHASLESALAERARLKEQDPRARFLVFRAEEVKP
jgi:hypothetical protein